ncbi:MAG: PLP-dependent aminotransferase family protein [Rhizobiaceae bacterium]|nr:PLP-dependent aminotransferase family protein [Rhizobiaceae bacterium]
MTNWLPSLEKSGNPLYIELADAIEHDIESGKLPPGTKLPPQRNIAFDIGVTVGTISRGYALARERGLVSGEIGRGTYVLDKAGVLDRTGTMLAPHAVLSKPGTNKTARHDVINFGYASAMDVGQDTTIAHVASGIAEGQPKKVMDYIRDIPDSWTEAGRKWLSTGGWTPDHETVIPTNGAHAGIMAAIVSITAPGDKVAFEGLTYCSVARSTALLGRRIAIAEFDEAGLIPEAFERLCAQQHPKVLYLMPAVQNPTLARLSRERRKAIGEIAHRYNVWIIEDFIYGPLVDDDCEPIAHFAPDRTFHVGGLSKAVSAGIRAGWIACPPRYAARIANAHKLMSGGGSFWLKEMASQIVLSGDADRVRHEIRRETEKRSALARKVLGDHDIVSRDSLPYMWIRLPEPWNSGTFKNTLADHRILVSDEDEFKPTRSEQVFHGVRVGFSSPHSWQELEAPFKIIRNLLESGNTGYDGGCE